MAKAVQNKIKALKKYFEKQPDVLLAFVFGSYAKGLVKEESDFDIAVYLKTESQEKEDEICSAAARIVEREVDLVDLREAPATLISNIFKTGIPLTIKDKKLYWELYLTKSTEAEDFLKFAEDYWEIYKKATSLIPEEKVRLFDRIQFLKSELEEIEKFTKLTFEEYRDDKFQRRNIERWAENILNATIDIAKVILASEKKRMPKTYEDALFYFLAFLGFSEAECEKFSKLANLRNILVHEYLDILFAKMQNFIAEAPPLYEKIFEFLEQYLKKD